MFPQSRSREKHLENNETTTKRRKKREEKWQKRVFKKRDYGAVNVSNIANLQKIVSALS